MVTLEHRGLGADPREECRLDLRVGPADENEGQQIQSQRVGGKLSVDAGDHAPLRQLADALVDG